MTDPKQARALIDRVRNAIAQFAPDVYWIADMMPQVLDTLAAALDDVDRLTSLHDAAARAVDSLETLEQRYGAEIERRDRNMERLRAALRKIHDDAVYDQNHERYLEIAAVLDETDNPPRESR